MFLASAAHLKTVLSTGRDLFTKPVYLLKERSPRKSMPSYRCLQQTAILILILSILYNGVQGGVSIGFSADVSSKSLLFFGIQSLVEVLSAILVVYGFRHVVQPDDETRTQLSPRNLCLEKHETSGIGSLFIILAAMTFATSSVALSKHQNNDTAL